MQGISDTEFENIDGTLETFDVQYGNRAINPNANEDFMSGIDGDVIDYQIEYGLTNVNPRTNEDEEFYDADGDYSNAKGKKRRKRKKRGGKIGGFFNKLLDNQKAKTQMKSKEADAKLLSEKNASKQAQSDNLMMSKLSKTDSDTLDSKPKMKLGVKIGIGVGIALVVGVVGFLVYKKMKNK